MLDLNVALRPPRSDVAGWLNESEWLTPGRAMAEALDGTGQPGDLGNHVPAVLHIAARRPGPRDFTGIFDVDGGARRRSRRADGGEFLLPVPRRTGEGRA